MHSEQLAASAAELQQAKEALQAAQASAVELQDAAAASQLECASLQSSIDDLKAQLGGYMGMANHVHRLAVWTGRHMPDACNASQSCLVLLRS